METAVLTHRYAASQAVQMGPLSKYSGSNFSGCRSSGLVNLDFGSDAKGFRAAPDAVAAAAALSRLGSGGLSGREDNRCTLNWREFSGGFGFHGSNVGSGAIASIASQKAVRPSLVRCDKMFVPGFWERSPERKAAENLHNFFTFIAVKIVLSQLQSYNPEGYNDLMDIVNRVSLKDGDKFFKTLMRESYRHKTLALRIMEVRSAYCKSDFEWESLERLCKKHVEDSNTRLMREYLVETSEFKE